MHRVEEIFLAAIVVIVPIFALAVDSEASPTTAPTTAPSGTVELEAVIKPDSVIDRKMSLVLDRKIIGFRLYYVNGKLAEETFAYGRVLHGWQRRWYDNGQLKQIRPYLTGRINGACQYWDVNGRQLPDDMVHNGCGVLHEYYSTGQVKSECPFVLGMKHGVERRWTEGGVLRGDCNFENGLQDGFDRVYQTDGKLEMESYDRRGKSLGVLTFWKADGTIDRQEGTRYEIDGEAVPLTELQQGEAADADIARSLESMALAPAQKLPLTTRPAPMPADAVELEIPMKPKSAGRKMALIHDQRIIGYRFYYSDGQQYEYLRDSETVRNGLERAWHENGRLSQGRPYVDGLVDGTCHYWDEEGRSLPTDVLRKGTGILRSYYKDGRRKSECPLIAGKKHGVERQWSASGALANDADYENGLLDGPSRQYNEDGALVDEGYFRKGKAIGKASAWDDQGHLRQPAQYYLDGQEASSSQVEAAASHDVDVARSLRSIAQLGDKSPRP